MRQPLFESLEARNLLANYTWNQSAGNLVVHLGTNESLNVNKGLGSGNVSFTLTTGTFQQSGGDTASGSGTDELTIAGADLDGFIEIDNSLAAAGANNVQFGSHLHIASDQISVELLKANNATGQISLLGTELTATGAGGIALETLQDIHVQGATLTTTSGDITLKANQGEIVNNNVAMGIFIESSGLIQSTSGDITVLGRSGNSYTGEGVMIAGGGQVGVGTTGRVTVEGRGGGNPEAPGVRVTGADSKITSGGGSISVTGNAGTADYIWNVGVYVDSGGQICAGGDGDVSIVATTGSGTVGDNVFALLVDGTGSITTNNGDITISADSVSISNTIDAGTKRVWFKTTTTDGSVDINLGGDDNASQLGLTNAELNFVTAGTIRIGDETDQAIIVSEAVTFNSGLVEFGGGASFNFVIRAALDFGSLNTLGTIDIDGHALALSGGYQAEKGDEFRIIAAGDVGGTFDGATSVMLNGVIFMIDYTADGVTLRAGPEVVVIGADAGTQPRVKVTNAENGTVISSFLAYRSSFSGGVRVALADLNGDGVSEIIVAPGAGTSALGKVFDILGHELRDYRFKAYKGFRGGFYVTTGDVNNDGLADIITSPDSGMTATINVFRNRVDHMSSDKPDAFTKIPMYSFLGFGKTFTGGATVASGDFTDDGIADIVVGNGPGMGPRVRVFDVTTFSEPVSTTLAPYILQIEPFQSTDRGGVFVAAGDIRDNAAPEIVVGNGLEGRGRVEQYAANGDRLKSFTAYGAGEGRKAPVHVAAKKFDGQMEGEIFTGQGPIDSLSAVDTTISRLLRSFHPDGTLIDEVFEGEDDFQYGFFVA